MTAPALKMVQRIQPIGGDWFPRPIFMVQGEPKAHERLLSFRAQPRNLAVAVAAQSAIRIPHLTVAGGTVQYSW
jgi:hypothetical protein